MKRIQAGLLLAMSAGALLGLALSHFALTDIARGQEPDLTMEWWIVRATFLWAALLAGLSAWSARRALDEGRSEDA